MESPTRWLGLTGTVFDGNPFCSQVASYFGDDAHEESYKVRLFSSKVVAIDTRSS